MSNNLHLGCGSKILDNFINIDIRPQDSRVLKEDISVLDSIADDSVDLIYACHVLEHFGRLEVSTVLSCWFRKLKKGGILRIAVPDLQKAAGLYLSGEYELEDMYGFLYGGQRHKFDHHHVGFDRTTLERRLSEAGFSEFRLWDWRQVDHGETDDYSQCYLPHMNKESGILMSLNLEAIK